MIAPKPRIVVGKIGVAVVSCLALAFSAVAEPAIDEKADELLKKLSSSITESQNLRVEVVTDISIEIGGLKQTTSNEQSVAIARPNRFAFHSSQGPMGVMTIVSNGERLYTYASNLEFYVEEEAPASLSEFQENQMNDIPGAGLMAEMQQNLPSVDVLLSDDPYDDLTSKVESVRYAQQEVVNGVEAHKLEFVSELIDFTLWIQDGDASLPVRATADLGKLFEELADAFPGGENMKASLEITYKDWDLAAALSDDDFAFSPPANARKADSFMQGIEEQLGRASSQQQPPQHPLEGESAPVFQAKLLNGGDFDLSENFGEKVIVLDFWATWCPPCRAAMPIMEDIAEEYHEDVIVLAVNQGEGPSVIQQYLESVDLQPTVLLDEAMDIGRLYSVQGYPTFVVIDQEGVVKNVFLGFHEQGIRTALKELAKTDE